MGKPTKDLDIFQKFAQSTHDYFSTYIKTLHTSKLGNSVTYNQAKMHNTKKQSALSGASGTSTIWLFGGYIPVSILFSFL